MLLIAYVILFVIVVALLVWFEMHETDWEKSLLPSLPERPDLVGASEMTLSYRFADLTPVPDGSDVVKQFLEVRVNGLPLADVPMRLDSTEVTISVPRNMSIEVVRCWEDLAGNTSHSEVTAFVSRDTLPPQQPPALGAFELVGEDD